MCIVQGLEARCCLIVEPAGIVQAAVGVGSSMDATIAAVGVGSGAIIAAIELGLGLSLTLAIRVDVVVGEGGLVTKVVVSTDGGGVGECLVVGNNGLLDVAERSGLVGVVAQGGGGISLSLSLGNMQTTGSLRNILTLSSVALGLHRVIGVGLVLHGLVVSDRFVSVGCVVVVVVNTGGGVVVESIVELRVGRDSQEELRKAVSKSMSGNIVSKLFLLLTTKQAFIVM